VVADLRRDGAAELDAVRGQPMRLARLPISGGMAPLSWLPTKASSEVADLRRDGAAELVAIQG
jgi:hypothetical protein